MTIHRLFRPQIELDCHCVNLNPLQALIRCGHYQRALEVYDSMMTQQDGYSHSLALRACIHCKDSERGKLIHQKLAQKLEEDTVQSVKLKSALIDFYGFFDLTSAWNLYDSVEDHLKDGRCVGAMMKALISNQHYQDALALYDRFLGMDVMEDKSSSYAISRSPTVQMLAIKACSHLFHLEAHSNDPSDSVYLEKGKAIHKSIDFKSAGSNELDLKNTLIHFYGNAMDLDTAKSIFDSIGDGMKDVVSLNAMMDAFCVNDCNQEAIDLFKGISNINPLIVPDVVTYKIVIAATTFVASSVESAVEIYEEIKDKMSERLESDQELQIKTMNMLSRYGLIAECREIFDFAESGNVEIWNAMIRAYCSNGQFESGYALYQKMDDIANVSTFEILLNALSHLGQRAEAQQIWEHEIADPNIKFDVKIVNVMADCFARTGRLETAFDFIVEFERQSGKQSDVVWNTLMSGCAKFNDKEMGQRVYDEMQHRFKSIESNSMTGARVSMANLYGAAGEFDRVGGIREK